MNHASLIRLTGTLVLVAITLSGPIANGHPCEKHQQQNHKHCAGSGGNPGDRIPGEATFADLPGDTIRSDDGILLFDGSYLDGDSTTDYQNEPASMQVAMNCQFNHFTLNPGGGDPGSGGRRIRIDFANDLTGQNSTGITSCIGHPNISVDNTDMTGPDCGGNGTDPDWAFQQLLRAFADSNANVCLLSGQQSVGATMRLQTNLYHLTNCKGGAKKCGVKLEAIDINYDNATITCTNLPAGTSPCTEWSVISNSVGFLAHGSGGEPAEGNYAVNITFDKKP